MESKTEEFMNLISAENLNLTEYSDILIYRIIEPITVLSKEEIRIRFMGGFEIIQPPMETFKRRVEYSKRYFSFQTTGDFFVNAFQSRASTRKLRLRLFFL